MRFGRAYLSGPKLQEILKFHPPGWQASFFLNVDGFGPAFKTIDNFLATETCPQCTIGLLWSDSHLFSDKDIPEIEKRSRRVQLLKNKYPHIKIEINTLVEHKLTNPDKYHDIAQKNAPKCTIVNNPETPDGRVSGAWSKKYKNEGHNDKIKLPPGAFNMVYDGQSSVDADVTVAKEKFKNAECISFWSPWDNGRMTVTDPTPRPQRKAYTTPEQNRSLIYLGNNKGNTSCPKNSIWKSHGDQHTSPPEPRACKPVFITPIDANTIKLVTKNGHTLLTAEKGPVYNEVNPPGGKKRYIFRFDSDYGYKLAEKAIALSGSPVCNLVAKGKIIGTVNPAFRDGSYR